MKVGGIILAGGKSTRFQGNKALVEVDSLRLIDRVVKVLQQVVDQLLIVTNSPEEYAGLGLPMTGDLIPGKGPLGGIHSGLVASPCEMNYVTACDMPFITPELVRYLIEVTRPKDDVVVPVVRGYPEPLSAVYSRRCIPFIEKSLIEEHLQIKYFYRFVSVHYLNEEEIAPLIEENTFFNINTRDDLKKAFPGWSEDC